MRTILVLVAFAATLAAAADATSSKKFVSKRYSYSIVLPADWTSSPASIRWRGGPPFQDRRRSTFTMPLTDARWRSQRGRCRERRRYAMGDGVRWTALPSFCKKSRGYRATTLGGVPALAFTGRCEVHDINVELTVRHGRGYTFALASPSADSEAADGGVFEAARRSFHFVASGTSANQAALPVAPDSSVESARWESSRCSPGAIMFWSAAAGALSPASRECRGGQSKPTTGIRLQVRRPWRWDFNVEIVPKVDRTDAPRRAIRFWQRRRLGAGLQRRELLEGGSEPTLTGRSDSR